MRKASMMRKARVWAPSWEQVDRPGYDPFIQRVFVHKALLGTYGQVWRPIEPTNDEDAAWKCPWCGYQMTLSHRGGPPYGWYYCWCECGFHDGPLDHKTHRKDLAKRKRT